MWGILLPFLAGLALGYFLPGKQDKSRLYTHGLVWSIVLAGLLSLVGAATGTDPLSLEPPGFFSLVLAFLVGLLLFVLGVWVGDLLEARRHRGAILLRRRTGRTL